MEQIKYDTIYRRLFAKIIDYVLIGIIIKIFTLFIPETTYNFNFENPTFPEALTENPNSLLTFWTAFGELMTSIFLISYFVLFHYFGGQTVGKMITNVKVFDINETKKIDFKQAILRNVPDIFYALTIFFISFEYLPFTLLSIWNIANLIQVLSNKQYRTINDLLAKTVVIRNLRTEKEAEIDV